MEVSQLPHTNFSFTSAEGLRLCRKIGQKYLPYDPHDVSIEAVANILDKKDVFVRTACGSGKTGIIALLVFVLRDIALNPTLTPTFKCWYDQDPVFLVICPTNALELDIEAKLKKYDINATALNSEILNTALHDANPQSVSELWRKVQRSSVILLSPELLKSDQVRINLGLDNPESRFQSQCTVLVVDEAHMVFVWGPNFREAYRLIGSTRSRFHQWVRLLCLTATLRAGAPMNYVLQTFGLQAGNYVDIHRSNLRPEIRVTTSLLQSSLSTALNFPELRWIVSLSGITIVFTPNRSTGLRVALYLRRCNTLLAHRVRKWDSLNDKGSYDAETMEMIKSLKTDSESLIIVSTTILMVGVDFAGVKRVLNLEPDDFDKELQMEGRMRARGESYVYVSKRVMEAAQKLVEAEKDSFNSLQVTTQTSKKQKTAVIASKGDDGKKLDRSYARRLVEPCRTIVQNQEYNNPSYGQPPCSCLGCSESFSDPPCLCSGCQPGKSERDIIESRLHTNSSVMSLANNLKDGTDSWNEGVIDEGTREIISKHLEELDDELFQQKIGNSGGLYVPGMFVKPVIPVITRHYQDACSTREKLLGALKDYGLHPDWLERIWLTVDTKITPALEKHNAERKKQELQEQKAAAEAQKLKQLVSLTDKNFEALLLHNPCLQSGDIHRDQKGLTVEKLKLELQWHRLWNPELRRPSSLRKDDLIQEVKKAVEQFHVEGRQVEDVRAFLQSRPTES